MDTNLKPTISINIATYNRGRFITEAIESVLAQTFNDWELIIIDDASTDNTAEIVRPYLADPRIKYLKNETNQNISLTRNRGLKESQGKYIAILDSDDLWCDQEKLTKQYDFLEKNPDHCLVGTGIIVVDEQGQEKSRYLNPETDKEIRNKILAKNTFAQSSVLYRKEAVLEVGSYNPNLNGIEDYDLWLKLGTKYKLANLPSYSLKYRIHGGNISLTDRWRLMKINLELIKKHHDDYPNFTLAILRRYSRLFLYFILKFFY